MSAQIEFFIYYHNDFDGLASAAIFARFLHLKNNLKFEDFYFRSLDYNLKKKWAEYPLAHPCCVLDFLYHHKSDWWFDHHESTFNTSASYIHPYKASEKKYWNKNFVSCPSLLISHFDKYFEECSIILKSRYKDLIKWSDIIDGARYKSPSDIYQNNTPYMNINRTIAWAEEDSYLYEIIKAFYFNDLSSILMSDKYNNLITKHRVIQEAAIEAVAKSIIIDNKIAFFDQSNYNFPFQRYLAFHLYPDILYRVAIYKKNGKFIVSVNYNNWIKGKNSINLGNLCSSLGGGGHSNVGAIIASDHDDAQKKANILINMIKNSMTKQLSIFQ